MNGATFEEKVKKALGSEYNYSIDGDLVVVWIDDDYPLDLYREYNVFDRKYLEFLNDALYTYNDVYEKLQEAGIDDPKLSVCNSGGCIDNLDYGKFEERAATLEEIARAVDNGNADRLYDLLRDIFGSSEAKEMVKDFFPDYEFDPWDTW